MIFDNSYFDETWYSAPMEDKEIMLSNRKLSTYINALAQNGFMIEQLIEENDDDMFSENSVSDFEKTAKMLPVTFVIKARKLEKKSRPTDVSKAFRARPQERTGISHESIPFDFDLRLRPSRPGNGLCRENRCGYGASRRHGRRIRAQSELRPARHRAAAAFDRAAL